ncbi:hypothetical protein GCM10009816_12910 [Microbacterium aquimaris]
MARSARNGLRCIFDSATDVFRACIEGALRARDTAQSAVYIRVTGGQRRSRTLIMQRKPLWTLSGHKTPGAGIGSGDGSHSLRAAHRPVLTIRATSSKGSPS